MDNGSSSTRRSSSRPARSACATRRALYLSPALRRASARAAAGETNSTARQHSREYENGGRTGIGEDGRAGERALEDADGREHEARADLDERRLLAVRALALALLLLRRGVLLDDLRAR